jgi:hypothetical protein
MEEHPDTAAGADMAHTADSHAIMRMAQRKILHTSLALG